LAVQAVPFNALEQGRLRGRQDAVGTDQGGAKPRDDGEEVMTPGGQKGFLRSSRKG